MRRRLRRPTLQKLRDPVLFLAGLAGIGYETISGGAEKPTLIIAFVGMMGLPLFIKPDADPPAPPTPPSVDGGLPDPKPGKRVNLTRPRPKRGPRHD